MQKDLFHSPWLLSVLSGSSLPPAEQLLGQFSGYCLKSLYQKFLHVSSLAFQSTGETKKKRPKKWTNYVVIAGAKYSPNLRGGDFIVEFLQDKASKDHYSFAIIKFLDMFVIIKHVCYSLMGKIIFIEWNNHWKPLSEVQLRTCHNSLLCCFYQKLVQK